MKRKSVQVNQIYFEGNEEKGGRERIALYCGRLLCYKKEFDAYVIYIHFRRMKARYGRGEKETRAAWDMVRHPICMITHNDDGIWAFESADEGKVEYHCNASLSTITTMLPV